jgi:hypothetical protein
MFEEEDHFGSLKFDIPVFQQAVKWIMKGQIILASTLVICCVVDDQEHSL